MVEGGNTGIVTDRGLTILIADADEETRLDLVEAIQASDPGARIIEACNGAELAAALSRDRIDILFIDVILPDTYAADVLAWRAGAGARSMIVLVTDLLAPRWPTVAQRVGAYDVLLKPLNRRHVERILAASQIIRRDLRLLVVDPRAATRALIQRLLRESHFSFEITEAEDGPNAVRAARLRPFDMAIVEFDLPGYPALEVTCQIGMHHPEAKILLMGFSAAALPARQLELFSAVGYLRKPFSFTDVDKAVHDAFGLWHPYLIKAIQAEESRAQAFPTSGGRIVLGV